MTDSSIKGSKKRAAERGQPDLGLIEAAATAGHSLGSPAVVERLVQGFAHRVIEIISWRSDGMIDADEMVEQLRGECTRVGAIFMGGDDAYTAVPGWNTDRGVGNAIRVLIGVDRVRAAASPPAALLEWLAGQLMAAALKADGDADEAGRLAQATVSSVIDTLLGSPAEA